MESGTKEEKLNFLSAAINLFEPLAEDAEVNYSKHLEFLKKNVELGDITPELLLDKYEQNGFSDALDYIKSFYSDYESMSYYNSHKFFEAKTDEFTGYLIYYSILASYFNFDSIKNNDFDFNLVSLDDKKIIQQKNAEVIEKGNLAQSIMKKVNYEIVAGCFK